jgi:hypothetical protein
MEIQTPWLRLLESEDLESADLDALVEALRRALRAFEVPAAESEAVRLLLAALQQPEAKERGVYFGGDETAYLLHLRIIEDTVACTVLRCGEQTEACCDLVGGEALNLVGWLWTERGNIPVLLLDGCRRVLCGGEEAWTSGPLCPDQLRRLAIWKVEDLRLSVEVTCTPTDSECRTERTVPCCEDSACAAAGRSSENP